MSIIDVLGALAEMDDAREAKTLADVADDLTREVIRVVSAKTEMVPDFDATRDDLVGTLVREIRQDLSALADEVQTLADGLTANDVEAWTRDGTSSRTVVRVQTREDTSRGSAVVSIRQTGTLGRALAKFATKPAPRKSAQAKVKEG